MEHLEDLDHLDINVPRDKMKPSEALVFRESFKKRLETRYKRILATKASLTPDRDLTTI